MLDAIIMSDLHLGSPLCKVDVLQGVLNTLPLTKRLILNGDVLESSEHRLNKKHWKILSKLRALSDELELVWVKGNHDWDADSVAYLIGASFVLEYIFESGLSKYLCIHGDRFDDFISKHKILTYVSDFFYMRLQKWIPKLAYLVKHNSKTFLHCCDKVREGAIKLSHKRCCSHVFSGHTHKHEVVEPYFNSGCWTEHDYCYYTVVNGLVKQEFVTV